MTRARLPIAMSFVRSATLPVVAAALWLGGCGGQEGNEPNMLPSAAQSSSGATDETGVADDNGQTESTAGAEMFPQTYRFSCVDIQIVGDGDGEAFQAIVLEGAWGADIAAFKLNIMLTVVERDDEAGTATLRVTSGVGTSAGDLCDQPSTITSDLSAVYEPGVASWQDASDQMICSQDGAGSDGVGTYDFALGPDDVVYVYAEDDDGTTFNCVPGGGKPNAVPIRAIEARVTMAPGEQVGYGNLTGCLAVSEATELCSCIGMCVGDPHPDCGGCPIGARPLATLLQGLNPSPRCTDLLGEDAFDLQLGMATEALGYATASCG